MSALFQTVSIVLQVFGVCWCISFAYVVQLLVRTARADDGPDLADRCASYTMHPGAES